MKSSPGRVGRREIAHAFGIKNEDRRRLTDLLKDMRAEGTVEKARGRNNLVRPGHLPPTAVLVVTGTDRDGELIARPDEWTGPAPAPRIVMAPAARGQPPLGIGDKVLARLNRLRDGFYEGRAIKRLSEGPSRVLGVYERNERGEGRLRPTDRRLKSDYLVTHADTGGAAHGELVAAEILPGRGLHGLRPARVIERLGSMSDPRAVSLISIHANDIPHVFPSPAVELAEAARAAPLAGRVDLRQMPLVTIDGEDARDFDDAVWAAPEEGGWHIAVAIADVAWYVRPGDALDREARKRGNSVYFPDRVVPMLPEALSNGWCSLRPREDRSCLVAHIWIDAHGNKKRHRFERALMRSAARLTYAQVQRALDGETDDTTGPLLDPVLRPLHAAWKALLEERQRRGALELDLPERQVIIGAHGRIDAILPRERYDSHRLIEDFMIAANVAAAQQIESLHQPCMYRVHDLPALERLDALREVLGSVGLHLPRGGRITAAQFNAILERVKGKPDARLVHQMVLRTQAQAVYSPTNIGHFGLGLARYAHFTSPIRRYADLLVHRALIAGLKLGDDGLPPDAALEFPAIGEAISGTERRAAAAERDALDRFTVLFLADRVGASFAGTVSGVARFGLFVTLDETGADGLLPMSALPADFYHHDEAHQRLVGKRSGRIYTLGDAIEVRLAEASPLTGSLTFQAIESAMPFRSRKGPKRPVKRGR